MKLVSIVILAVSIIACNNQPAKTVNGSIETLPLDSIKAIANEAYTYGYPLVDNYRVMYAYYIDKNAPGYKASWNQITNIPNVYTPEDTEVQTPNSDTPYSWAGLDLRAEPIVLSVPNVEAKRWYSIMFTDTYTFNFDYAGTRTTGNDAGKFMVVGPGWKGKTPEGIKKVVRSETDFISAIYRTQLFNPADIDNVIKVQDGYKVQTLSNYLETEAPASAPTVDWIKPLTKDDQKTSLEFFNIVNFVLKYSPTDPTEVELMKRFAKIGVGSGVTFDPTKLSPEVKKAIEQGRSEAWADFEAGTKELGEGKITAGDLFGTRQYMKNNYLHRWLGTIGIYGNSKQAAMYPVYTFDSDGNSLSGANKYTLTFAKGELPPVNAFWSLTMYNLPQSLLVVNPINRYLINSPMLPNMKKANDGSLTLYIQNESPGKALESNWLPAPKGAFSMYMRLYWPKEAAIDGSWTAPKLIKVNKKK